METKFFSVGSNRVLGSLALLMLIFALGAYSLYTFKQSEYLYFGPTTISVTGEAEVMAVPDIGQFSFTVMVKETNAATARNEAAKKVNDIMDYLATAGVEEKDIKNQNFNLYQDYRYETRNCTFGSYCPPGEQIPDGFVVTQTIAVKVRDINTAGDLIAGVSERGATDLSNLEFTIDDDGILRAQARSEAIADAYAQALVLASNLEMRLGRMTSFNENGGVSEPYYARSAMMYNEMAMDSVESTPLPVGENSTRSSVTITFLIH
jgi:hypothetical protein